MELFGWFSAIWFLSGFLTGVVMTALDKIKGFPIFSRENFIGIVVVTVFGLVGAVVILKDFKKEFLASISGKSYQFEYRKVYQK